MSTDENRPSTERTAQERSAEDQPMDPMAAFAELGRISLENADLQQVLTRVAQLARIVIPEADEVSVTLVAGGSAATAAYTGEIAITLDETQYDQGDGPCLSAAAHRETVVIADMGEEQRWPWFTERAIERGVHSSASVGLPIQPTLNGALNMYSTKPGAFDADALTLAQTFASYAAVAIANAHLYSTTSALADQMEEAMKSRAIIEMAKGILIAQQHVTPDEAFTMLSRASQSANRKLRDIAQAIVDGALKQ